MSKDDKYESSVNCINSWISSAFKVWFFISCNSSQIIFLFSWLMSVSLWWNWVFTLVGEKTDINLRKSEKSFRNFIRNLRERTADEMMKSETVTESDQKKMRQNRNRLYTISYETQVQRWKINETAITIKRVKWWWRETRELSLNK